jgi:hypothetical protein
VQIGDVLLGIFPTPVHRASQGRTVQCSAKTRVLLNKCHAEVLQALFFAEDRGTLLLRIALSASSAGALDARISSLAEPTRAALNLQAGTSAFTNERLLDCTGAGASEAHTTLLPGFLPRWTFR